MRLMIRKTKLLTAVVVVTVLLAGCGAQSSLRFEATPGSFAGEAVEEAGYEQASDREIVRNRTFEAGGSTRNVTVINYGAVYTRTAEIQPLGERKIAAAAVFTTPSISILGSEQNPLASAPPRRLVSRASNVAGDDLPGDGLRDVQFEETRQRTTLDTETNLSVFSATTTIEGVSVDVVVWVARVKHDGDFVIVAGAFPERLEDHERPRVETLFDNVVHEETN